MMKDKSRRWIIVINITFMVIGLYTISTYSKIYEGRTAYLYDKKSDDVFKVELTPYVNKYNKSDPFILFKSLKYSTPTSAEYLGKLESIITEHKENVELLLNDIDAWREKATQSIDSQRQFVRDSIVVHESWHIQYYTKTDNKYKDNIPIILSDIIMNSGVNENKEIISVSASVVKEVKYLNDDFNKEVSIITLQNALLFKGKAAYILYSNGLY